MSTKVRVNLREMYPKYYNQDCFVEVDQDVYETMNKYDHIDAVYKRKVDDHKGYFSLDRSPFLELEKEKMQSIAYLQGLIQSDEKKNLEEKIQELKTALEYFDEIIKAKEPNRIILQMIIDKIYIHRDKTIRFKLKTNIEKLLK